MREHKSFLERLIRRAVYKHYGRNLLFELQLRACREAADYVERHMRDAAIFEDSRLFLLHCLSASCEGALLEFGVAGGRTATILGDARPDRTLHGFDSFEGLPEDWAGHLNRRGAFSRRGKLPKVPLNVRLHKGWFCDTIPAWLADNPERVGFLHVDCDIYSSARDVLWGLRSRLQQGTVIVFDEYFNYPNWQQHEARALREFVEEFDVSYDYIAYTASNGAAAIRLTSDPNDRSFPDCTSAVAAAMSGAK
jgi:hypothetical protein